MSHIPAFTPVTMRRREDGWTAERQTGFLEALAATANVQAACKAVGMSAASVYELRARPGAASFREAWQIALDYAVHRLAEAAFDRALNGTATPVFFRGEQVGERRRYDERLAMFILGRRDPQRYGRWRADVMPLAGEHQAHEIEAARLAVAVARVGIDADAAERGAPRAKPWRPLPAVRLLSRRETEALEIARAEIVVGDEEACEDVARRARADADDAAEEARWPAGQAEVDTRGGT